MGAPTNLAATSFIDLFQMLTLFILTFEDRLVSRSIPILVYGSSVEFPQHVRGQRIKLDLDYYQTARRIPQRGYR